ncbi:DMT family transporter [Ralstonia mannitolilytica]|mgnify:CR=1 FL=1|jgi:drug/metabolite transporter (DMT)-like permease|uniref:DMT family transporter n=1 Tax=Ralstonia mannitolilytica TaxID=105219 RepID=UPI000C7A0459|nr:DMT family transporter [Ralstonia mannitolilytica]AUM00521.1 EamA family transporter [Rhodocyclaceae bacterium]
MKLNDSGIPAALAAAVLFGAGTPLAKLLLEHAGPWLLAALLYLGSGLGLWLLRQVRQSPTTQLARGDWLWLAGAVATGGVAGPVLLMTGLTAMPASGAALLLNAEGVFTALLAWFVFKENFDRRIALGMIAIVAGAVVLSWPAEGTVEFASLWPALAVLGACLAWAIDNNLTRKVALSDASWIAMVKGLAAGATNLVVAVSLGAAWPGAAPVLGAALVGFFSYGTSLTLFVVALRHLGTARTGAYFSGAPFFGALMALALLHEPVTVALLLGGTLMAVGVALHLTERHVHEHMHEPLEHTHAHAHGAGDEHHMHEHGEPVPAGTRHSHQHRHHRITHAHPHFPDAHHQHLH